MFSTFAFISTTWLACGILDYGISFGYLQGKYPQIARLEYNNQRIYCSIMALLGPCALIASLWCGWVGKYPLKWK
jgi:hypothetical protein